MKPTNSSITFNFGNSNFLKINNAQHIEIPQNGDCAVLVLEAIAGGKNNLITLMEKKAGLDIDQRKLNELNQKDTRDLVANYFKNILRISLDYKKGFELAVKSDIESLLLDYMEKLKKNDAINNDVLLFIHKLLSYIFNDHASSMNFEVKDETELTNKIISYESEISKKIQEIEQNILEKIVESYCDALIDCGRSLFFSQGSLKFLAEILNLPFIVVSNDTEDGFFINSHTIFLPEEKNVQKNLDLIIFNWNGLHTDAINLGSLDEKPANDFLKNCRDKLKHEADSNNISTNPEHYQFYMRYNSEPVNRGDDVDENEGESEGENILFGKENSLTETISDLHNASSSKAQKEPSYPSFSFLPPDPIKPLRSTSSKESTASIMPSVIPERPKQPERQSVKAMAAASSSKVSLIPDLSWNLPKFKLRDPILPPAFDRKREIKNDVLNIPRPLKDSDAEIYADNVNSMFTAIEKISPRESDFGDKIIEEKNNQGSKINTYATHISHIQNKINPGRAMNTGLVIYTQGEQLEKFIRRFHEDQPNEVLLQQSKPTNLFDLLIYFSDKPFRDIGFTLPADLGGNRSSLFENAKLNMPHDKNRQLSIHHCKNILDVLIELTKNYRDNTAIKPSAGQQLQILDQVIGIALQNFVKFIKTNIAKVHEQTISSHEIRQAYKGIWKLIMYGLALYRLSSPDQSKQAMPHFLSHFKPETPLPDIAVKDYKVILGFLKKETSDLLKNVEPLFAYQAISDNMPFIIKGKEILADNKKGLAFHPADPYNPDYVFPH